MKKTRTGIYGGSFNPIHNGHIAIARKMTELADLDEVWFVVSPQNPLKRADSLLADSLRLDMARRALAPYPKLCASDCEFRLPRPSYMWNTLQWLTATYPDREFTLLIGADNWTCFGRWSHSQDIIAHYPIRIYPRTGFPVDEHSLPPSVRLVDTGLYDISSTLVRERISKGESIEGLIPECICHMAEQYYGNGVQEHEQ